MYAIGRLCFKYRKEVAKLTLKEMSKKTGIKVSTLSAFEVGRSGNMNIFFEYVQILNNEQQKSFMRELRCVLNAWKEN